jgi:NAD(P)-dependent dehydrogenase (short-subunit alcohol dehydrogenase family)
VLAAEFSEKGVTFNAIAAGFFSTKMTAGIIRMAGGAETLGQRLPLKRYSLVSSCSGIRRLFLREERWWRMRRCSVGTPEDIGGVCLWLASRAGQWVTGAILTVDGGHLIAPSL